MDIDDIDIDGLYKYDSNGSDMASRDGSLVTIKHRNNSMVRVVFTDSLSADVSPKHIHKASGFAKNVVEPVTLDETLVFGGTMTATEVNESHPIETEKYVMRVTDSDTDYVMKEAPKEDDRMTIPIEIDLDAINWLADVAGAINDVMTYRVDEGEYSIAGTLEVYFNGHKTLFNIKPNGNGDYVVVINT